MAEEAAVRGLDDVRELATQREEMRDVNTGKTGPQWDRKVNGKGRGASAQFWWSQTYLRSPSSLPKDRLDLSTPVCDYKERKSEHARQHDKADERPT